MKTQEKELALGVMKELAVKAGEAIMALYGEDTEVRVKEDGSPVTKADMKAERIIRQGLLRAFPDLRILSEETIDNRSRL